MTSATTRGALIATLWSIGCGRIGFDGQTDAPGATDAPERRDAARASCLIPVGHDEDGDGVDDACDGCPHLADPDQIDSDGDGVDDLCDPHPDEAIDRIAFFDPFTSADPRWSFPGAMPTYSGDDLVVDSTLAYFTGNLAVTPTTDLFTFGATITVVTSTTQQATLSVEQDHDHTYYCELYDVAPEAAFNITTTVDGTSFMRIATVGSQPLAPGDLTMTLDNAAPTVTCATTWPSAAQTLMAPIPIEIVPANVNISANGLVIRYHWFIDIHSGP